MFSFIATLLVRYGLGGVAALMLVENLIPIIPSELILPFVGFEAARGRMAFALALAVATVSSTVGGLAWYALGRGLGLERTANWAERHGAWTTLNRKDIEMGCRWFKRWGGWAVMVGRALPGIRSFIPVPAGIARQRVAVFLAWSGIGALAWSALLMAVGFLLQSRYAAAKHWLDPVLDGVVALALLAYVFRFLRCHRLRKAAARAAGAVTGGPAGRAAAMAPIRQPAKHS